CQQCITNPWTF
nr:immunoglobulin light chain junction region [Macaca mulatta]